MGDHDLGVQAQALEIPHRQGCPYGEFLLHPGVSVSAGNSIIFNYSVIVLESVYKLASRRTNRAGGRAKR